MIEDAKVAEYVKSGCQRCPLCGSDKTYGDGIRVDDGDTVTRLVHCGNCSQDFREVWGVLGLEEVE